MADNIGIDVDVDSTPIDRLNRATDKLGRGMRDAQGRFVATGRAAQQAGSGIRGAGAAATRAEREVSRMGQEMGRLQGHMRGVVNLGGAVRGAFLAFAGFGIIRSLQQVTGEIQKTNMTFMQVTGSAEGARREMAYVSLTADRLGQDVRTAASAYARLLAASDAANMPLRDTRNLFEGLTAAATAFGLSQYELEGALNAVQQMLSKGSVQAEELRGQLGERLPGAYQIAADAMGMTTAELSKALELGKVSAQEFVTVFGQELQSRFGAFAESADTSTRKINELENAVFDLQKRIIEGGFMDAMISVLELLTGLAASDGAQKMAAGLGQTFKVMAENAEIATIALGGMVAIIGVIAPIPAAIAGITAALTLLATRTIEVKGEQVTLWDIAIRRTVEAKATMGAHINAIADIARDLMGAFSDTVASIGVDLGMLGRAWDITVQAAGQFVEEIIRAINYMASILTQILQNLGRVFSDFFTSLKADLAAVQNIASMVAAGDMAGLANMGIEKLGAEWGKFTDEVREFGGAVVSTFNGTSTAVEDTTDRIGEAATEVVNMHTEAQRTAEEAIARYREMGGVAGTVAEGVEDVTTRIRETWRATAEAEADAARIRRQNRTADEKLIQQSRDHQQKKLDEAMAAAAELAAATKETEKATKGAGSATKKLTDEEKAAKKAAEDLKKTWEDIASTIGDALLMISQGEWINGAEGVLGGVQQAIMAGPGGQALKAEADMMGKAIAGAFEKLGSSKIFGALGLEGTQAQAAGAQVGVGLAGAATAALKGDMKQVGTQLGSTAGSVIGRMGGVALGKALGGAGAVFGPIGAVVGGAIGGLLGGALGGGSPMGNVQGTAFAGTPFERKVDLGSVLQKDTRDYSARIAWKGISDAADDFRDILKDLAGDVASVPGAINMPGEANGSKLAKRITGQEFEDVTKVSRDNAQAVAQQFEKSFMQVVDIALSVSLAGVDRANAVQQQYRQINDQFTGENRKILKALGFSSQQISHARNEYLKELRGSFEEGLIQTIVDSGKATKDHLVKWRDAEIAALKDGRAQARTTAKEIGASVDVVNDAYKIQIEEVQEKFREMLEEMGEAIDAFARAGFNAGVYGQIMQVAPDRFSQTDAEQYAAAQRQVLRKQRNDAIDEAKKLGGDVTAVRRLYSMQILALEEQTQARLRDIRTRAQDFMVGMFETIRDLGGATMADAEGWMAARRVQIEAEREAALERAQRLGVDGVLINRAFDLQLEKLADQFQDFVDEIANAITAEQREVVTAAMAMASALRQAHDRIAETVAEMQTGAASPLGRQARLSAAQAQFEEARAAGMGGDAEAAQRAAEIAQTVLGLGREVYGSSGGYADLFAQINTALTALQTQTGQQAEDLETKLASDTLDEITRQSEIQQVGFSEMVARLDGVIASLEAQRAQTRRDDARAAAQ